jgi:hypothetical protein
MPVPFKVNPRPVAILGVALALLQRLLGHAAPAPRFQPATTEDYLYKIARITGQSEYEVFRKSAEAWPVSESMVNRDFRDYLLEQSVPCYVNAFIRKNKPYIDQVRLPPY